MPKILFLDTETNELNDKALIQFAGIQVTYGPGQVFKAFKDIFVKLPAGKKISLMAMSVNHITEEDLEHKWRPLEDVIPEVNGFLKDCILVAHNADYDKAVLKKNGFYIDESQWIDTYTVAYNLWDESEVENYQLQYLRYFLKLKFPMETIIPHDALSDVKVLEKVFDAMYEKIRKESWSEEDILSSMIDQTTKWIILRQFSFWQYQWKKISDIAKTDPWYISRLYKSENSKPEATRNKNMIRTLESFIYW